MCHIRKYVIFWYEKKKVEAFSFFFHIFIKKDGRRRDRDISIEIQMKLDILPFQKRSFPQPLLLLHTPKHYLLKKKRNVKRTNYSVVVVVHCGLKSKNWEAPSTFFVFVIFKEEASHPRPWLSSWVSNRMQSVKIKNLFKNVDFGLLVNRHQTTCTL